MAKKSCWGTSASGRRTFYGPDCDKSQSLCYIQKPARGGYYLYCPKSENPKKSGAQTSAMVDWFTSLDKAKRALVREHNKRGKRWEVKN